MADGAQLPRGWQHARGVERHQAVTTAHTSRIAALAIATTVALVTVAGCDGPAATSTTAPPGAPGASAPSVDATSSPVVEPARTPRLSLPPPQEPRLDTPPADAPTRVPTTDGRFPPEPACPGPQAAPGIPPIVATVGDGDPVTGRIGSFTIQTCATTGTGDVVGGDPETPLVAAPSDDIVVTVAAPWHGVQWEGSDRPREGDAANVWPPVRLPERPRSFTLDVPPRNGDSILTLELLLVSDDGRAVASIPVSFLVRVQP
jgi:hypothetical protein